MGVWVIMVIITQSEATSGTKVLMNCYAGQTCVAYIVFCEYRILVVFEYLVGLLCVDSTYNFLLNFTRLFVFQSNSSSHVHGQSRLEGLRIPEQLQYSKPKRTTFLTDDHGCHLCHCLLCHVKM